MICYEYDRLYDRLSLFGAILWLCWLCYDCLWEAGSCEADDCRTEAPLDLGLPSFIFFTVCYFRLVFGQYYLVFSEHHGTVKGFVDALPGS